MIFMQMDTPLPAYLPYPRFLRQIPLSETAKLIYVLLLDRARLSQANGWADEQGKVYIYYPIADLARDSGKCAMTVKTALADLEELDLLVRCRRGVGRANLLYIRVPETEICLSKGHCTVPYKDRKLSGNQSKDYSYTDGESL